MKATSGHGGLPLLNPADIRERQESSSAQGACGPSVYSFRITLDLRGGWVAIRHGGSVVGAKSLLLLSVVVGAMVAACDSRSGLTTQEESAVNAGTASSATLRHLAKMQTESVRREVAAALGSDDPTLLDPPPPISSSRGKRDDAYCGRLRDKTMESRQQLLARADDILNGRVDPNDGALAHAIAQAKAEMTNSCYDKDKN